LDENVQQTYQLYQVFQNMRRSVYLLNHSIVVFGLQFMYKHAASAASFQEMKVSASKTYCWNIYCNNNTVLFAKVGKLWSEVKCSYEAEIRFISCY